MNLRGSFWLDGDNLWMRKGRVPLNYGSIYERLEFTGEYITLMLRLFLTTPLMISTNVAVLPMENLNS